MNCDCDYPAVYNAKLVRTRKPHKCCECRQPIDRGQQAEKVDALWDEFQTIYTCLDCVAVRDRIKEVYPDELCCHGEMYDFLWQSDLLWDEDEIEEETSEWVAGYNNSLGVIRTKVDWLRWQDGRLCLIQKGEQSETV